MNEPIAISAVEALPERSAFEAFFEAERERVFRALVLVTRDAHEAEELEQEAFCRVWERWETVGEMDSPTGYVFRVALNLHRSRWRAASRTLRRSIRPEDAPDPFEEIAARDEAVRVLGALSTRQRAAAVLTGLLGFSSEEAGEILGIRAGTVRTLLTQARTKLATVEVDDA